ncbi:hypothetical protein EI42_04430 [Thermosporothrix hazakensis]|uniref:Uncharacterized protein n=1 Tax=Thermosporothrix hazakensis TaxID=644383 RepID=A0A326U2H1_THEHA|nr:hypothetical protein [Thermosporothrix hazakensis]PZW24823.1 hypothetical protein EI42_04430 [Thermosporothrix hazakensis]GCE46487.1 hypothetical protein KTH_13560 [Thermosporothrix hazakensis]
MRYVLLLCFFFSSLFFLLPSHRLTTMADCTPASPPTDSIDPAPVQGLLLINEIIPLSGEPASEQACIPQLASLQIELYSRANSPINLGGLRFQLAENPAALSETFLQQTTVTGGAFYLYAISFDQAIPFSPQQEFTLQLLIGDTLYDSVKVPGLAAGSAYARVPDGEKNWISTLQPTPGQSNPTQETPPTATVTRTPTVTPVATQRPQKPTEKQGSGGSSPTRTPGQHKETPPKTVVNGVQPDWNSLQEPDSTPPPVAVPPSLPPLLPQAIVENSPPIPRQALVTACSVALALSLFWVWFLLKRTRQKRTTP